MERPIIPAFPPAPELTDTVEVFDQKAFALAASLEPQRKKFNEVAQYVGEAAAEVEDNLAQTRVEVGKAEAEVVKAEAEATKAANFAQDSEASALAAFESEQLARGYAEDMEDVIAGDTYVISEDTPTIEITGVGTSSNPFKASLKSGEGVLGAPLVSTGAGGGVKFEDKSLGSWAYTSPFSTVWRDHAVVIDDMGNLTYAKARLGDQALAAATPLRVVSTSVTAVKYQTIGVNTSSAARTITLPANPEPGDWVRFFDSHASWDKNNPTIARNGSRIMGKLENMIVDIKGRNFTLTYVDETNGWMITA